MSYKKAPSIKHIEQKRRNAFEEQRENLDKAIREKVNNGTE